MEILTIESAHLKAAETRMHDRGIRIVRRRRPGTDQHGISVVDLGVQLPAAWTGSMSEFMWSLPGIRARRSRFVLGRWRKWILNLLFWRLTPSGADL